MCVLWFFFWRCGGFCLLCAGRIAAAAPTLLGVQERERGSGRLRVTLRFALLREGCCVRYLDLV